MCPETDILEQEKKAVADMIAVRAITPDNAVISVGDNRYGHPAEEALRRLQAVGATVWRTDQQGSIRIIID